MTTIYPVIMCGGAGTRLWPVSRKASPKQYHALVNERTMLEDTVLRVAKAGELDIAAPSFVSAQDHADIIKTQSKNQGISPLFLILEPFGRNTAPVAAIVSEIFQAHDPDGLVLLLPADHFIQDAAGFWARIKDGIAQAQAGALMTLGIHPTSPETGYGYIRSGDPTGTNTYMVDAFVEKPELSIAKQYLDSGDYYWNAGIFLFAPDTMLSAFKSHAPEFLIPCQNTLSKSPNQDGMIVLDADEFAKCPANSIDFAIMEKADNVGLIAPVDIGWNDIGSWTALYELTKSENGNAISENVIQIDCEGTIIRTDGPLVAGVGLDNFIVIATHDAVLVMPKDRAQDVKSIIAQLEDKKLTDLL